MIRRDLAERRVRVGIIGGGQGAFIGAAHRIAVELDGQALIVAGALSSDPTRARASAAAWHLQRSYDSFSEMARAEATRDDGIDFAIVATPNHLHATVSAAFLEQGIPVVCDKPLAHTLDDANALAATVARSGVPFAVTYNYSGYPAVREARERVRTGLVGDVRKVMVHYHQDWLMTALELSGNKQAAWRTDPARAGAGGCVADIGTHAFQLMEYITARSARSLCADLSTFVAGRAAPDDAQMLVRLDGGAKGVLSCSQIACGEQNDLSIQVYGSKGGLEWHQEKPVTLIYKPAGQPAQLLQASTSAMSAFSRSASRLPAGHPEGYLEAFAVLYREYIADLRRIARGESARGDYPGIEDGVRGMRFIACALESSGQGSRWVSL